MGEQMNTKFDTDRDIEIYNEASELFDKRDFLMRSCWKCNKGHQHLKKADYMFACFVCGHFFYKGKDITKIQEKLENNNEEKK